MARRSQAIERPSPNCGPRPDDCAIDLLILHYTGMESVEAALTRLCDPVAAVSAHYLINETGTTYRLVDESMRAWHAGDSAWSGATDINGRSVGIELANPGHEFGYRAFPEPQMATLELLGKDIVDRHRIPPAGVLAHSDVAPGRRCDPGELFDWARLARAGIALWPRPNALGTKDGSAFEPGASGPAIGEFQSDLARLGYAVPLTETIDPETRLVVEAFQRHYRPRRIDGAIDPETRRILADLLAQVG